MQHQYIPEIVINATHIAEEPIEAQYEFVLDESLHLTECGKVESISRGLIERVNDPGFCLKNDLFELNHVRVNPELDNTCILTELARALKESGVDILNVPDKEMLSICFKPMGELSDIVRFHVNPDNTLTFLSAAVKLKLVQ